MCKVHSPKLLTKYEEKNFTSKFVSFITGVNDTGDKHSFANCIGKIGNGPNGILLLRGPGKTDS